jgi:hypothetical protein
LIPYNQVSGKQTMSAAAHGFQVVCYVL